MDAETRQRWEAYHQQWTKEFLDGQERQDKRRAWRRRHPWLVRSGIGVAIAAYIGVIGAAGFGLGGVLSGETCRTVNIHVDAPLLAPRTGG